MPEEQKLGSTNPYLCSKLHEVIVAYKSMVQAAIATQDSDVVKTKAAELEILVHKLAHDGDEFTTADEG
jgi:hypothetical protein